MVNRARTIKLQSGGEEGYRWELAIGIHENIKVFTGSFTFGGEEQKRRHKIRSSDKSWVIHHIPSSIWWFNEVHHDWEDGGRMYILDKKEHRRRDKKCLLQNRK